MNYSQALVVIATKGRAKETRVLLDYLLRQTLRPACTLIIGTTSDDIAGLSDHPLLASDGGEAFISPRMGAGCQRNVGLDTLLSRGHFDTSGGDSFCVFFDDDFRPNDDWLEHAATRFKKGDICGLTGRVLADGVKTGGYSEVQASEFLSGKRAPLSHWANMTAEKTTECAYGCNMAFISTVARRIRFDENLPLYSWQEDRDYTGQALKLHLGSVMRVPACIGVHMGSSGGRTSGLRFGYSQIANPIYLMKKGTMSIRPGIRHILKNFAANAFKAFRPEPWIDRSGRLKGNLIAFFDLITGRISPARILELHDKRKYSVSSFPKSQSPGRVLVVSSVFPPDVIGGAEISAWNLAQWLKRQGFEVGVLTTAKNPQSTCEAVEEDGLKIWRVWMPRSYSIHGFAAASDWQKPLWHLQDHVDPRNRKIVAKVLDEFKPDWANIHVLQGMGYNVLSEFADRKIPTVYFLHDLSLVCFRMSMFKNGQDCKGQCWPCKASSAYKLAQINKVPQLGFCSPSKANMEKISKYFPLEKRPRIVALNANAYPKASAPHTRSEHLRLLYVGRLHSSKGVQFLIDVLTPLSSQFKFTLTIIGNGQDEKSLLEKNKHLSWCEFKGFIQHQDISDYMANSDLLCVPSIWAENSPGVIVHALGLGLPVIGSNTGGIPELIEDRLNGLLIPTGDNSAWTTALSEILAVPEVLNKWSNYASQNKQKFEQDALAHRIVDFIESVRK